MLIANLPAVTDDLQRGAIVSLGPIIGAIIRLGIGRRVVADHLRHFLGEVERGAR